MKVSTCGIDLAKNVFAVHGVDVHGHVCLRKQLRRQDMAVFFTRMEPCLIGMEASPRVRIIVASIEPRTRGR